MKRVAQILQKFITYGVRFAIYGDFSNYTSKPLKDFMYESNRGKDIYFQPTCRVFCPVYMNRAEIYHVC